MKKLTRLASVFCSLLCVFSTLTACGEEDLSTPIGLNINVENEIHWDAVEGARKYMIEIKNLTTGKVEPLVVYTTYYSISGYAEGDYEIRVKAMAGANMDKDSDWSKVLEVSKSYETGCVYKLVNSSEYEIVGAGSAAGIVKIEDVYRNKPVTSIADGAFQSNNVIENVILGNNVKSIGHNAFRSCKKLTSITIPESVTEIGEAAFLSCNALKSVRVPGGVETLSKNAFSYCRGLEEVELGEGIKTIGEKAFSYCDSVAEIVIPDSVELIETNAFLEAKGISTLTFGSGVKEIGESAFMDVIGLTSLNFAEGSCLEKIGDYAFCGDENLSNVVLPEGLKEIGRQAFNSCFALKTIDIPDSLEHIGEYAFHATAHYRGQLEAGESYIYLENWLLGCEEETQQNLEEITAATLKEDVVGIADQVFVASPKLLKVTLPTSVNYIGEHAFFGCEKLWRIEAFKATPDSEIGAAGKIFEKAFASCPYLTNVYFGKNLKEIGDYAFYGCTGLNNSTSQTTKLIPDSVEKVGTYAFKNTGLWKMNTKGIIYAADWVVGYEENSNLGDVVLKEETAGIADYAFYQCTSLKGINADIPQFIGKGAFYSCDSLSTISLNINLKRIEDYTFYKCGSLFEVPLPSMMDSIGRSAFYKCSYLNSINLSACLVKTIDDYAFYGCKNMKKLDLGDDVESIGDYAFYGCSKISEINVPDSVKYLGSRSFGKCTSLETLTLGAGLDRIRTYTFNGCSALKELYIPANIKTLEKGAFYKCTGLEKVEIASGLESIGDYAFYTSSAKIINLPSTVKEIGKYAFRGMNNVQSFTLSTDVESIGSHAFYGAKNATIYTEEQQAKEGWNERWNSSQRPVIWGCELSEDKSYVVGLTVTETTITNAYQTIKEDTGEVDENGNPIYNVKKIIAITAPQRVGYVFMGWALEKGGEAKYSALQLIDVPVGTKVYAVWAESFEVPEENPEIGEGEPS